MAGPAERGGVQGFRRLGLRNLRRLLFPRQEGARRRRRQFRRRRGAVSFQHRRRGHGRSSPQFVPRGKDPLRTARRAAQRQSEMEPRDRRDPRPAGSARGDRRAAAQHPDRRERRNRRRRNLRRDRPCAGERTGARPARAEAERLCADDPGLDRDQRRRRFRRRRRRGRSSFARPSPPPASAAWRRSRPNAGSPRRRPRAKRRSNRARKLLYEISN